MAIRDSNNVNRMSRCVELYCVKTLYHKNSSIRRSVYLQLGYILGIYPAGPRKAAVMIFGMVGPLADVITSAKFGVDRFVGFCSTRW